MTFNLICVSVCVQGIYLSGKELRKLILPKTAPFEEKLHIHREVLCARHLPVFYEWFLRTFPDPTSWYDPTYNSPCSYIYEGHCFTSISKNLILFFGRLEI